MKPLEGKVALVAGATRGAGRGIATALGESGATVWCTGRSSRAAPGEGLGRPETIEETAELVTRAGGRGIAARVDHRDEAQVRALVERVRAESGRLDIVVNDIWGGERLTEWGVPFWQMDAQKGLAMLRTAIDTHLLTARHAVPLMLDTLRRAERPGPGLLVEVTDGDHGRYRGSLYYDLVKSSVQRLAFAFHHELRPHGATALAVTPGFLRSEEMLAHFGVTKATWREAAKKDPNFAHSETPLFVGRAVAALAADPRVASKGGRVWASWTLSDEYGFADEDGSRPHWGRHFASAFGEDAAPPLDEGFYRYWGEKGLLDAVAEKDPDVVARMQ